MPFRLRVVCALVGGVALTFGYLFGQDALSYTEVSALDLLGPAVVGGLGIGLLATAFLPRD
jgi:hypothetical protein